MNNPLEISYYPSRIIKGEFVIKVDKVKMYVHVRDFESEYEAEQFCQLIVNNLTKEKMEEQLTLATRELIYNDIEKIKEEIATKERIIKFAQEEGDESRMQFLQIWRIEVEMMHHQVYFLKTKLFS